jgi:hypothetical protein
VIEVCTKDKRNEPRVSASHLESKKRQDQSEDSWNQNNQHDDWLDYTDTDWEEESSKNESINQDKFSRCIDNPGAFVEEEISQAGQMLGSLLNTLGNALPNSLNPEDREYYQDRNGEIKNLKRDINRSPKRSRSSKQPEPLIDTSFGFVEKEDSKEKKTQKNQEATDSSNKDKDWFS